MLENRGANKLGFKLLKSIKTGSIKGEQDISPYKVYKRLSNYTIVLYKLLVKIIES